MNLESYIMSDLAEVLEVESNSDMKLLNMKLKNAIAEVRRVRNYPASYKEETIEKDLSKYYSNIVSLTIWDYEHIGGEHELEHNENGISRTWSSRKDCLVGVLPFLGSFK